MAQAKPSPFHIRWHACKPKELRKFRLSTQAKNQTENLASPSAATPPLANAGALHQSNRTGKSTAAANWHRITFMRNRHCLDKMVFEKDASTAVSIFSICRQPLHFAARSLIQQGHPRTRPAELPAARTLATNSQESYPKPSHISVNMRAKRPSQNNTVDLTDIDFIHQQAEPCIKAALATGLREHHFASR